MVGMEVLTGEFDPGVDCLTWLLFIKWGGLWMGLGVDCGSGYGFGLKGG